MQDIEAIEKRLWTSADNLRANSNHASNEYFLPVMGLIFLRHTFSRYFTVKDGLEESIHRKKLREKLIWFISTFLQDIQMRSIMCMLERHLTNG